MKKSLGFALMTGLFLALPMFLQAASGKKGVAGSVHDFSLEYWSVEQGLCSPCHQAHKSANTQIVPLWAHATTAAHFTTYDSPTFNAGPHAPTGVSLGCLSCHDGTVAINQMIGGLESTTGDAEYISRADQIGTDLHVMHPVSFTYDPALAAADGGLEDPTTYHIGDTKSIITMNTAPVPTVWPVGGVSIVGKSIDQAMLFNHKVECCSCHDVHQQDGSAPFSTTLLRLDGSDSGGRRDLLCRTCHIK